MTRRSTPDARERRLADGLRRRDPGALHQIYADWGPITFGYLLGVLGDRLAAEDVQQQVFLEAWNRGDQYDPERASLSTWLLMLARSRATDHIRRRRREPVEPSGAADSVPGFDPGPDARLDDLLEEWRMAHLLRQLPAGEAMLLRLRFYRGMTQAEIAEHTGLPLGTVKSRMASGLLQLRELIEREGEGG